MTRTNTPGRRWKRGVAAALALAVSAALWLPVLHLLFRPRLGDYYADTGLPPAVRALAARHLRLWTDPAARRGEIARMRRSNAEWDFMGRTFLVLALANIGLRDPAEKPACLEAMDAILTETLRIEQEEGPFYFLMDYAQTAPFRDPRRRSLFLDGEIALMLGARRLLEESDPWRAPFAERIRVIREQLEAGPALCGESYPNECWIFCNAVAIAALRMSEALDDTSHGAFIDRWMANLQARLCDPLSGLPVSSCTWEGEPLDGPEGSSVWMIAHGLELADPAWAARTYRTARRLLGRSALGFAYAREWPPHWKGPMDIDSGPVIPFLEISAGSSGMAFIGAAAFGDRAYLRGLLTSLQFGGFPETRNGERRYAASNQVGDAVLLYALVQGPLWAEIAQRAPRPGGEADHD